MVLPENNTKNPFNYRKYSLQQNTTGIRLNQTNFKKTNNVMHRSFLISKAVNDKNTNKNHIHREMNTFKWRRQNDTTALLFSTNGIELEVNTTHKHL
ncbi:hypothetical protein GCM10007916_03100 [Psychromonas marina]|uniref:Uncharacterized protein n=1 Tax=Psychromonas marina TaxID=88364 RepID=A0ABQ6DW43_9GAMM|nr:hypothetical protein GCM10007916_03100 [Psychromonas marina]